MIKLEINGIEVELQEPTTVLEAARRAGIKIPTLCYFDGLPPFGGCRLCLVEVEKLPKLQTACTLMVADGMVVRTETPRIKAARKAILEFLLINHPLDCPYCDKAGECELQDLVAQYGPEAGRFAEGKRTVPENLKDPFIARNMQRCVLCTRCVRMCESRQGAYAISVTGRGNHSFVEPFNEDRFDCEYCGNCITVCPVGSLVSKLHRHSYRPWFVEKEAQTICPYCGVGCRMVVQTRAGSIIRTIPRMDLGLNKGLLCVRGRFGYDYIDSTERLRTAYMLKEGQKKTATIEEAIAYAAKRLKEIKDRYGPGAIGAIGSGRCTNEDNYMLQRLMRYTLGTNNIDTLARLYYLPAVGFFESLFGQGVTANLIPGIQNADGVVVVGGDPTKINPVLGVQIRAAARQGARVVVIGPAGGLRRFVNYELNPGLEAEDALLEAALKKVYDERGQQGPEWLQRVVQGIKDTGEALEGVDRLVEDLRSMENPVVIVGPEVVLRPGAKRRLFVLASLVQLLNARVFVLSDRPNYQGAIDMGAAAEYLPGARPLEVATFRHKVDSAIGIETPADRGLDLFGMLREAERGNLKALVVMGEDLLHWLPWAEPVLENLEFLMVMDLFMTPTAQKAHVVVPVAGWSEKTGTFVNLERRLQRLDEAKPSQGLMPDWQVLARLAKALGQEAVPEDLKALWAEIGQVSALHAGITPEELGPDGLLFPYHGEALRLGEAHPEVPSPEPWPGRDGNRLYLLPEWPLYHNGSMSGHSKALRQLQPEPYGLISTVDAARLAIQDGQMVKLRDLNLKVRVSEDVEPGVLRLPQVFRDINFQQLVSIRRDPETGALALEDNTAEVQKV